MTALLERHCKHEAAALGEAELQALPAQLPGWTIAGGRLEKSFAFRDYHETIAFVNALAWMVHREDHHPLLSVGYNRVAVAWSTHSAGNRISENDLICAAKTDALYAGRYGA